MLFQIFAFGLIALIKITTSNENVTAKSTVIVKNVVPVNVTKDGKTYFFKYNTNNNQFRIYNRVNVNSEGVKNSTLIADKEKAAGKSSRSTMNELRKYEAFLDEEWNYSTSQKVNTTELPLQIYPFLYNAIVEKASKKSHNVERIPDVTKILFNKKENNSMVLNFNVGKMEQNYEIDNAELHFYWSVPENSDFYKNSCVLRLYEVASNSNYTIAAKNPDTHKLLNVIYASKAQTGWQMFRIAKKSIQNWVNMRGDLKLLISLSQANQVNSTTVFNDTDNKTKWRTFLIIKIRNTDNGSEDTEIAPPTNSTSFENNAYKYCTKRNFYIDFRKLHWSNFIIAPEGFMAYNCNGKCNRHNTDMFSNHQKILTTFEDVDKKIRMPCCVPTKFYSLPIMFYDKNGNVVLKLYKDLIAAECECR